MFESCFTDNCCDGYCTVLDKRTRKARKPHKCGECGHSIAPGERYEFVSEVFDGEIGTHKTCAACCNVRDSLFPDGGWSFGELWEYIHEAYCWGKDEDGDRFCICPQPERNNHA